jgi:hypothetical protein
MAPSPPLEERAGERRPFVDASLSQYTNYADPVSSFKSARTVW